MILKADMGGEFIFYLFNYIGLESTYVRWGDEDKIDGSQTQRGTRYDYEPELWLLRVGAGYYKENWEFSAVDTATGDRLNTDHVIWITGFS